jgi:multicomponent Na+:H+ antiporter subunit F
MTGIDLALIVMAVAFALALYRGVTGPTLPDRAVAADVCLYAVVAGLALLAIRQDSEAFLDVVLVATLLGFLASVALARLIEGYRER